MNVGNLKSLIEKLLADESDANVQEALSTLSISLERFASAPHDQGAQLQLAANQQVLRERLLNLSSRYDPVQLAQLERIGAAEYFSRALISRIDVAIAENPMTPAVVFQQVKELTSARGKFLESLNAANRSLSALGLEANIPEPGTAEIGFQIPRALFDNSLQKLITELRTINRILRAFSELTLGHVEQVEVKDISTSNPLFYFGLTPITIGALAGAVTWALNTWKQIEDIRKLRSETAKNKSFTAEEIKTFYDNKIEATIKQAIAENSGNLVANSKVDANRREEQKTDVAWALESLLARIERGMTVEIRFLPPIKDQESGDASATAEPPEFSALRKASEQLSFPKADPTPILTLPPADPPSTAAAQ